MDRHPDLDVTDVAAGVRLALRVLPRSSRTTVDGVRDRRLLVRVTAPPVDAAANRAAIGALADYLGVPRGTIRIVSGAAGRNKTVEIAGMSSAAILTIVARLR
jgi:uncharacterized protein (TIGR00251 family)